MPIKYQPNLFDDEDGQPDFGQSRVSFPVALLGLASIPGLGQTGIQRLARRFSDSLGVVFNYPQPALADLFRELGLSAANKVSEFIANNPYEIIRRGEEAVVGFGDKLVSVVAPSRIPHSFETINGDAPQWLFVEGDPDVLRRRPCIAVVGTRSPSQEGKRATAEIARVLEPYPVTVVSGLADGIDAVAHDRTLAANLCNCAFLGHGVNLFFPEETIKLRHRIVRQGGAVVSEYLPDQRYQRRQFVERNRLQAALADLVIPVEGASASGTAHTVRFARKYGKKIVGVRFPGAAGIVDDLAKDNYPVVDVTTDAGLRELDGLVRGVFEESQKPPYPFKRLEQYARRELRTRTYQPQDVERLIDSIRQATQQEPPTNG